MTPKRTWNWPRVAAWLAVTRPRPSRTPPASTTARVPHRSESAPQMNDPTPMQTKLRSAAVEILVRDQPITSDRGWRKTLSESIAPSPTHVTTTPYTDNDPAVEEPHRCALAPPRVISTSDRWAGRRVPSFTLMRQRLRATSHASCETMRLYCMVRSPLGCPTCLWPLPGVESHRSRTGQRQSDTPMRSPVLQVIIHALTLMTT